MLRIQVIANRLNVSKKLQVVILSDVLRFFDFPFISFPSSYVYLHVRDIFKILQLFRLLGVFVLRLFIYFRCYIFSYIRIIQLVVVPSYVLCLHRSQHPQRREHDME